MWYDNLDLNTIRPIAKNISDSDRVQTYFDEVCKLQILPAVGADVYQQIENGTILPTDELLVGGYYTKTCGSKTKTEYQNGLNKAVLYLVYSRLIMNNQVNVTAFGVVQKKTDVSEPTDEKNIIRQANEAETIGKEYLRQVVDYLKTLSPEDCCNRNVRVNNFKMRAIPGNDNYQWNLRNRLWNFREEYGRVFPDRWCQY